MSLDWSTAGRQTTKVDHGVGGEGTCSGEPGQQQHAHQVFKEHQLIHSLLGFFFVQQVLTRGFRTNV